MNPVTDSQFHHQFHDTVKRRFLLREDGAMYATAQLFMYERSMRVLEDQIRYSGAHLQQGYLPMSTIPLMIMELGVPLNFDITQARLRAQELSPNGSDSCKTYSFAVKSSDGVNSKTIETTVNRYFFEKWWPRTHGKRLEKLRLTKNINGYGAVEFDLYADRNDLLVAGVKFADCAAAQRVVPLGHDISDTARYTDLHLAR